MSEVSRVDTWSPGEVETPLELARDYERRFRPALRLLFSTGLRRGELLGLKWNDVDFEGRRLLVRRARVRNQLKVPKSGKARSVAISPALASDLLDLLAQRRSETLSKGWPDVPEWLFPSETGGPLDEHNFERTWLRLRRRARKHGVRPLRLHCTRHTYASFALAAGKSVRWVAQQLGHSSPELTLRTYAHVLREEETDLSFADVGVQSDGDAVGGVTGRLYTSPTDGERDEQSRKSATTMVTQAGFEPATPSFGGWCSIHAELLGHPGEDEPHANAVVGRTGLEPVTSAV